MRPLLSIHLQQHAAVCVEPRFLLCKFLDGLVGQTVDGPNLSVRMWLEHPIAAPGFEHLHPLILQSQARTSSTHSATTRRPRPSRVSTAFFDDRVVTQHPTTPGNRRGGKKLRVATRYREQLGLNRSGFRITEAGKSLSKAHGPA